jgi:hypothetical protein
MKIIKRLMEKVET